LTNMEDIHNSEHRCELNKQKLKDSDKVSPENKDAIQRFINKSFAEGISKARVRKYITDFHSMLQLVDEIELLDADKEDLERLVAEIEQADYAEATKSDFKCVIKKFYKIMEGDGREYPDKVGFIDTTIDKSEQDMPDILDKEEIEEIIKACKNDRDRAMYKVLYEAGLRAGELMKLRVGDVSFVSSGVKLNVRGKTGNRKLLVVESERYLRNWLSKHPFENQRNAPLWVKVDGNNIDEKTPEEMAVKYGYMRINLKRKAAKAGIRVERKDNGNKSSEVYPHLFRHSRATHLATELTEAAMKEYFGWTQGSDMPQTYIHLSGRDIDNEIKQMYGLEAEKEEKKEKQCSRCFKKYKGEENFCPRCGGPLDTIASREVEKLEDAGEKVIKEKMEGLNKKELFERIKKLERKLN
jgi:integrase/recombinase XerD